MDKWVKRDKKLNRRRALKFIRKAMKEEEPRKKKRRYKSHADEEWDMNRLLAEEFDK